MLSILATPTERDTGNFWRLCYVYYLDILTASQVYAYSKYIKLYTLSIQFFFLYINYTSVSLLKHNTIILWLLLSPTNTIQLQDQCSGMWCECGQGELLTWQGAAQDSEYLSKGPGRMANINGWRQNLQLEPRSVFFRTSPVSRFLLPLQLTLLVLLT